MEDLVHVIDVSDVISSLYQVLVVKQYVLCIVFECIAIYCHFAIWGLDFGKKTFHVRIWMLLVKKRIYTLYNLINRKKLKCVIQVLEVQSFLQCND